MAQDMPTSSTSTIMVCLQGALPDGSLDPRPPFLCDPPLTDDFPSTKRFIVPGEYGIPISTWDVPYSRDTIRLLAAVLTTKRECAVNHLFTAPKGMDFPQPLTKKTFRQFRWPDWLPVPTLAQKLTVLAALKTLEADVSLQYQLIWDDIHLQVHNCPELSEELCDWVRSVFSSCRSVVQVFEHRFAELEGERKGSDKANHTFSPE